jgi:hypothetical protein
MLSRLSLVLVSQLLTATTSQSLASFQNSTYLLIILHPVNFTSALRSHLTKLPIKFKMSAPNASQA